MVLTTKKITETWHVKVFYISGARINDMNHHLMPVIANPPNYLILHIGTNDATTNLSIKIIDDLLTLKCDILKQLPNCRVLVPNYTIQISRKKANLTLCNINKNMERLSLECTENSNIILVGKDCI